MKLPSLFTLKGYLRPDSLDNTPTWKSLGSVAVVQTILVATLVTLFNRLDWITFEKITVLGFKLSSFWLIGSIIIFTTSPLLFVLRKASSWFSWSIVFFGYFVAELYQYELNATASHPAWVFHFEKFAFWLPDHFSKLLFTVLTLSKITTIFTLFVSRLVASILWGTPITNGASKEQFYQLFGKSWATETIAKPKRDIGFWLLRLAGFGYLGFWGVLALGQLGASPWPDSLQYMINMGNANLALSMNTYIKEWLMIMLAFLGAYNIALRYYVCIVLVAGHLFSTLYTLLFYLNPSSTISYRDYLLTSTFVEGSLLSIFIFVMVKYRANRGDFQAIKEIPINFSIPLTLQKIVFSGLTIICILIGMSMLAFRIWGNPTEGWGLIFSAPDPMLGNTITLFVSWAAISLLLINRISLRQHFTNLIIFPMVLGAILGLVWIVFADVKIINQYGIFQHIDWYLGLYACVFLLIAGLLAFLRQLYYKIDCGINTLSPSATDNIRALVQALGAEQNQLLGDEKNLSLITSSIDRYISGIRGRKRGILNVPFSLLEHIFNTLFGMKPPFSSMNRDEQRYFLNHYIFRNEWQRKSSSVPIISEFAYQIGLSLNALTQFAFYTNANVRHSIGYVPADARDRLQSNGALFNPPYREVAPLPKSPNDAHNYEQIQDLKIPAPRVSTPTHEADLPEEVDYLIIGSGAGGASAAYRLVECIQKEFTDALGKIDEQKVREAASKIVVVERGSRLQPRQDFQDNEFDMMKKIYKEGGLQQTNQFTMTMLQGECVGGTTVSNNAVCFEMPESVAKIWKETYGIPVEEIFNEYPTIKSELNVKPLNPLGINEIVADKFKTGVEGYNQNPPLGASKLTEPKVLEVNHLENIGDGNWNLGNKKLRKRSMLETYIPWSEAWGVKVIANWSALRLQKNEAGTKANSVLLRADNGAIRIVKVNKAVIVAGGVIASSHFLMRSELNNPQVGQQISCNFGMPLAFEFDEPIKAFDGEQITLYSHSEQPDSKVVFETYFNPPAAFALACMPFVFERRDDFMKNYDKLLNFGGLIGSDAMGSIQPKANILNGQAFDWTLSEKDVENIKYAIITLVKLGQAAGAKKVIIPTKPGILLNLQNTSEVNDFIQHFETYPLQLTDLFMGTAHPQGGNKMASQQHAYERVVDENFGVVGLDNVYVVDASVFPTSINVNPQLTIMAMASLAAKKIFAKHQ